MCGQQHFTVIAATDLLDDVVLALDDHGGHRKFPDLIDSEGLLLVQNVVLVVVLEVVWEIVLLVVVKVGGMKIVEAVVLEVGVLEVEIAIEVVAIEITVRVVRAVGRVELLRRHLTGGRIHHPVRVHLLLLLVHHF